MPPKLGSELHPEAVPAADIAPGGTASRVKTPSNVKPAPRSGLRALLSSPTRYVAWVVLALSLAVTVVGWRYVHFTETRRANAMFERDATSVVRRLEARLTYYEDALSGIAAFASIESEDKEGLTRENWDEFVRVVGADRKYPGILSVSFARVDRTTGKIPVTQAYSGIGANRDAIGFNIDRPETRTALDTARDTGEPAITGRMPLIFAGGTPGFLMYVPTFRANTALETVEDRRADLIGYVVAVFHAQKFVTGALTNTPAGIAFSIYDGDGTAAEDRLYGNVPADGADSQQKLVVGGRQWLFAISRGAVPRHGLEVEVPVVGGALTLVLFGLTLALAQALERRKQINVVLARRNVRRLALAEVGRFALMNADVDVVIDKALAVLAEQTGAEYAGLLEYDAARNHMIRRHGFGWHGDYAPQSDALRDDAPASLTLTRQRAVVVEDWWSDPHFSLSPFLARHGVRSSVHVQVPDQDRPYGVLGVHSIRPGVFGEENVVFIEAIANLIAEALRRKRSNALLHQAQKMEAVGQLTGGIAHDFNNLLTVVMGNMELLLDDSSVPDRQRSSLEMTMQAARRGADLTQKMLAFSRRQPLRPNVVELDRVIGEMEGLLKRTLGEHIEVETHLPRDLWKTHVDRTQLETAILNLAVNSRDAMPNGGRLVIEAENTELDDTFASTNEIPRVGPYVCLTIADTGMGMTPGVLTHVFEPFFTTKEVGKGSGLGLSMVYGFVRQSGGYVKIYSEEGQGTTVRLYLPRTEVETAQVKDTKRTLARGHETLLVVEDDPMVREIAVGMIAKLGYEVVVATDGNEALAVLDSGRHIDLMFSDVVMPGGISGTELAAEAVARRPQLKVLLTSGYSEHTVTNAGGEALAFPLISKPYRAADLAARIRAILDADTSPLASVA